ncbi:hypothetical protein L218DRAFT_861267, partial [Marasmius fiardii PR-910]
KQIRKSVRNNAISRNIRQFLFEYYMAGSKWGSTRKTFSSESRTTCTYCGKSESMM